MSVAKIYRCTRCGAEIPQKEFLNRRDKVVCPVCGKTLFRWQVIQRQDAAKPLGDPPMGVRVRTGMMASDRPYEDRIAYSRRKLSGILIGLWVALAFGGGGVMALMESNLLGIVFLLPGGFGLYWLLFELFGHDDLHLYAQSGAYTSGQRLVDRDVLRTRFWYNGECETISIRELANSMGSTMNKLMVIAAAGIFLGGCRTAKVEALDDDGETSEEVVGCMCGGIEDFEPSPMIELQARFIRVRQETLDEIGSGLFPKKEKGHRYDLADFEGVPAKRLESLLIARRDLIANEAPRTIARNGEEAIIKSVTEYIYPTDFAVKMNEPATSGTNVVGAVREFGIAAVEPKMFTMREVGTILDCTPTVVIDGEIDCKVNAEVVEPPKWQGYGVEVPSPNGSTYGLPMNQPFFPVRSLDTSFSIVPGETLLIGSMVLSEAKDVSELIFVHARLLDAHGREVKPKQ